MSETIQVGDKVTWTRRSHAQPFTGTVLYIVGAYARVDVSNGLPGWTTLDKLTRLEGDHERTSVG